MLDGYEVEQWLVRTEPPVRDRGITTDRVLVDRHDPDRANGSDWTIFCTGVYSLDPNDFDRRLGGHKMTATTRPDQHVPGRFHQGTLPAKTEGMLNGGRHEIRLRGWRRVAWYLQRPAPVRNALAWFDHSVPGTRGRLQKAGEPWRWRQG